MPTTGEIKIIGVIFPLEERLATELFVKVFFSLKENKKIKVLLKPHPMMRKGAIENFCSALVHGLNAVVLINGDHSRAKVF